MVPSYPKPQIQGTPASAAAAASTTITTETARNGQETAKAPDHQNDTFEYVPSTFHENIKSTWWNMYDALCEYKTEHGHCNIPESSKEQPLLAQWVKYQRKQWRKTRSGEPRLTLFQIKAMERIGFIWKEKDLVWYNRYEELRQFKKQHGHCNVPPSNDSLYTWVENQRFQDKELCSGHRSHLTPQRLQALQEIGLLWYTSRDLTKKPIPNPTDPVHFPLPNLVKKSAESKAATKLEVKTAHIPESNPSEHRALVVQSPMIPIPKPSHHNPPPPPTHRKSISQPNPKSFTRTSKPRKADDAYWFSMFGVLKKFKDSHGHCYVPQTGNGIEKWILTQQREYKKFVRGSSLTLDQTKVAALNSLGFNWDSRDSLWMSYYHELCHVKTWNNGLCRIPANYGHPELRAWVAVQRNQYGWFQNGEWSELTHRKIEMLNNIGFFWNAKDEHWWNMFDRLRSFKSKNGHFYVTGTEEALLSDWLNGLRMDRLPMDRVQALHRIGFTAKSSALVPPGFPPIRGPPRDGTSNMPVCLDLSSAEGSAHAQHAYPQDSAMGE